MVSSADNGSSVFLPPEYVLDDPGDPAALAGALETALSAPPPGPFVWPRDKPAGIAPYLDLVRGLLA